MKRRPLFACVVALFTTGLHAAEPPRFAATPLDLRPLVGYNSAQAVAMNDLGEVVGYGQGGPEGETPMPTWIWKPAGGVSQHPEIRLFPQDMNNAGQVVLSGGTGAVWTPGAGVQNLVGHSDNPTGETVPRAINNAGVVTGHAYQFTPLGGIQHLAVWPTPGTIQLLGLSNGEATDINDRGDVVGWPVVSGGAISSDHAFLRTAAGQLVDLGTLPGRRRSYASRVNNLGHVIGTAGETLFDNPSGFFWTPEQGMWGFDALTGINVVPTALNDADAVVGIASFPTHRIVYWSPTHGLHDLQSLLDPSAAGWTITDVTDINDAGQVLAFATRAAERTYLLLTPVPEPAGALSLLAGLAFVATRPPRRTPGPVGK